MPWSFPSPSRLSLRTEPYEGVPAVSASGTTPGPTERRRSRVVCDRNIVDDDETPLPCESCALEQDGDVVAFIDRDDAYHPGSPEKGIAEIIVLKVWLSSSI